jgi:hypothetical protein
MVIPSQTGTWYKVLRGEGGKTVIDFIDSFMDPPIQFLQTILDYLQRATLVAANGINLSDYVSYIGLLGSGWVQVLNSIIASFGLILVIFVAQKIYALYLAFKDGIEWW